MLESLALPDARVGIYSESLNPFKSKAFERIAGRPKNTAEYPRNLVFLAPRGEIASHRCG
jgi:hypothetical protein